MVRTMLIATCLLAVAALAPAQSANVWVGELTGTDVRVRSGPDLNWYAVGKLSAPARVTVTGRQGEWLAIVPPKGTYSLISKLYVKAEGAAGTVIGDRVTVRAGSDLHPTQRNCVQTYLGKGAKVSIVGQDEEYYKIAPPSNVRVFLSARFVKPAAGAVAPGGLGPDGTPPTATRPADGTTTRPADGATTRPAGDGADAAMKALQAVEAVLQTEYAKPRDQRDLAGLIAQYQAVDAPADSPVGRLVQWRLRFLARAVERTKGIEEARRLMAEAQAERRQLDAFLTRSRAGGDSTTPPAPYAVVGRIAPSGLYPGNGVAPKRWIVRDDAGVIVCLVQNTGEPVDLKGAEGWQVALKGIRKYDAGTRAFIVEATSVTKIPGGEPIVPKPRLITPPTPPTKPDTDGGTTPAPTTPDADGKTTTDPAPPAAPPADVPETTDTEPKPSPVNPDEYE